MPTCGNQKTNMLNWTPPGPLGCSCWQSRCISTATYVYTYVSIQLWFKTTIEIYLVSKRHEREEIIDPKNMYVWYNHKTKSAATEPWITDLFCSDVHLDQEVLDAPRRKWRKVCRVGCEQPHQLLPRQTRQKEAERQKLLDHHLGSNKLANSEKNTQNTEQTRLEGRCWGQVIWATNERVRPDTNSLPSLHCPDQGSGTKRQNDIAVLQSPQNIPVGWDFSTNLQHTVFL